MACEKLYFEICFVRPSGGLESSIFGFAEFISALALLVIVYTLTDIRYRFRLAVAPTPLFRLTYCLIGAIGFGTLLTDIWLRERWLVPVSLLSQSVWQGMFGAFFLLLAMTWIYYGFIGPPIFSVKNYRKFAQELYRIIVQGSDIELPVIANELVRSAKALVALCTETRPRWGQDADDKEKQKMREPDVGDYARDVLLMIGNRKLCRHLIASSPVTARAFFDAMTSSNKYHLPIGQFARNISTEAIINEDSILYHEDAGYWSGLLGYLKPFSQAVYGNYHLVEALGLDGRSPLDIDYRWIRAWNSSQLEAYSRAVMITLKSYLESGNWGQHSYVLYRALKNIESSCQDVYKLKEIPADYYSTDIFQRLRTVVRFVTDAINLLGQEQKLPSTTLRIRGDRPEQDFYDRIAALMFNIILSAASVTAPPGKCWDIQHNAVWAEFGLSGEGNAWEIVHFKLCRLLYGEIRRLEEMPNYQSSRILGFCLNVMGLKLGDKKKGYLRNFYPLHKAVLAWTGKNYLRLKRIQPEVAESCLMGSISFDQQDTRLVKTYAKGLNLETPKDYFKLSS